VRSRVVDYGVLPVENSLAGSVQAAYDVLASGGLTIEGEVVIPIRHHLLGCPKSRITDLRRVISHPVALAQCSDFLSGRADLGVVAVYDTAGAALQVAREGNREVAAVASRAAGHRYGLEVLAADIQDRDDNQTRFFVVRHQELDPPPSSDRQVPRSAGEAGEESMVWKSVLLLDIEDRPGALYRIIEPFAERGISLSKLESRPGRVPWQYRFILEIRARVLVPEVAEAVELARGRSASLSVLGSFPVGA
jgi:prephenate dehydratase